VLVHGLKTIPERGVVRLCEPFKFWWAPTISETAKARVVKFCALVGYVRSQHKNGKSPLNGRGQGHVIYTLKVGAPNDISRTAKARIVTFCTHIDCIKS